MTRTVNQTSGDRDRDTFLRNDVVLTRTVDRLEALERSLETRLHHPVDERGRLVLTSAQSQLRNLIATLSTFRRDADRRVLHTYSQYTTDQLDVATSSQSADFDFDSPPRVCVETLLSDQARLRAVYKNMARQSGVELVEEAFSSLAELMGAANQRLAATLGRRNDI